MKKSVVHDTNIALLPLQTWVRGIDLAPINPGAITQANTCAWYDPMLYAGINSYNPFFLGESGGEDMDKYFIEEAHMQVTIPNNSPSVMQVTAYHYLTKLPTQIGSMIDVLGDNPPRGVGANYAQWQVEPFDARMFSYMFKTYNTRRYTINPGQSITLHCIPDKGRGSAGTVVRPIDWQAGGVSVRVAGLTRGILLKVRCTPWASLSEDPDYSEIIGAIGPRYSTIRVDYRYRYRYMQLPFITQNENNYTVGYEELDTHAPGTYGLKPTPANVTP